MRNIRSLRSNEQLRRHCRYSCFLGAALWLAALPLLPPGDTWAIAALLLFVPLVLIRLGFAFLIPYGPTVRYSTWYFASYFQLPAAIAFAVAFLLPVGTTAMTLTIPWLAFALLLAGLAVDRLVREQLEFADYGQIAAMLFLPIGAGWALLSRAGLRPLDFSPVIVLLTAIHFHYAGLALPLLAGAVARHRRTWLSKATLLGVLIGVPLVAVGITTSQIGGPKEVEFLAAAVLAVTGIVLGAQTIRIAPEFRRWTHALLLITGASLIFSLSWSAIYAAGQYGVIEPWNIPFMVYTHGVVNAVGVAFCGLLGWHLVFTAGKTSLPTQPGETVLAHDRSLRSTLPTRSELVLHHGDVNF